MAWPKACSKLRGTDASVAHSSACGVESTSRCGFCETATGGSCRRLVPPTECRCLQNSVEGVVKLEASACRKRDSASLDVAESSSVMGVAEQLDVNRRNMKMFAAPRPSFLLMHPTSLFSPNVRSTVQIKSTYTATNLRPNPKRAFKLVPADAANHSTMSAPIPTGMMGIVGARVDRLAG